MSRTQIHLEELLSKRVRDDQGRPVGRIEEMVLADRGGEAVIVEYHLGPNALAERMSARLSSWTFARAAGHRPPPIVVARWDQLDVRDPDHPRLTCPESELERRPRR
jgi:hypothetical protein